MAFSSSNSTSARALQSSVLPTPVGPRKMNEPIGRFGSCRPLRLRRTALATAVDRFVLADDALVEPLFEHEQLGPLGFQHARDGDAGPGADDFGDFVGADFLAQQAALAAARPLPSLRRLASAAASSSCFASCLRFLIELVQLLIVGLRRPACRRLAFP